MEMRIGGKEVSSPDDTWIEVKNPATGELIDRVPAGSAADVAEAVDAAGEAFDTWRKKGMRERGMVLFHAAEKVREQHKDLARLLTLEQGKPLREAIDEVRGYANILEYYAGISAQPAGETVRLGMAGDALVVREPLGVCDHPVEHARPYHGLENRAGTARRKYPGLKTCFHDPPDKSPACSNP
jgi:betaine-aldehyde dehydrogenase